MIERKVASAHHVRASAVAVIVLLVSSMAAGCRDTRPDPEYCDNCEADRQLASPMAATATMTGVQSSDSSVQTMSDSATGPARSGTSSSDDPSQPVMTNQVDGSGANKAGSSASQAANTAANTAGAGAQEQEQAQAGTRGLEPAGGTTTTGGAGASDTETGEGDSEPRDAGTTEPGSGGSGNPSTEMEPMLPCAGGCPDDWPVCDEATMRCVQCSRSDQSACTGSTPVCDFTRGLCVTCTVDDPRGCTDGMRHMCNRSNQCVVCLLDNPNSCPAAQPICENEERCVECLPGMTGHCPIGLGQCAPEGRCVQCTDNTHCADPAKPRCDPATFTCAGCEGPNDCGPKYPDWLPFCDPQTHACVACTPEDEQQHCGSGRFCDPGTRTCMRGMPTLDNCALCSRDNECGPSDSVAACIERNQELGCFAAATAAQPCAQGYAPRKVQGRNIEYCLPRVEVSCQAIGNAQRSMDCNDGSACGKGGECRNSLCTVPCRVDAECPENMLCDPMLQACVLGPGAF